jgi:hypothetical protein
VRSRGFFPFSVIAALIVLAAGAPEARAGNQCEKVQSRKTPDFDDVEAGECKPVEKAKETCRRLKSDVEDAKKRSAAACTSVQDSAESPGSCGPSQRYTHACDAAYNHRMSGVAGSAAATHHGDSKKIDEGAKQCRREIDAAKAAAKSDEKCKGKEGELEKLDSAQKDADDFAKETGNTGDMFDDRSKEFATNEGTASGRTEGDESLPGRGGASPSGANGGTVSGGGNGGSAESGGTAPTASPQNGGQGQQVSNPGPAQMPSASPAASPSTISPPSAPAGSGGGGQGASPTAPASVAAASPGPGNEPLPIVAAASPSYATPTDAASSGTPRSTPAQPAKRAAEAAPAAAQAAPPTGSLENVRRELFRSLAGEAARGTAAAPGAEGAGGGADGNLSSAELARAGIAPAEARRDPATGAWEGASPSVPAAGGGSQAEALDTFARPLGGPRIALAGPDTDQAVRKLLAASSDNAEADDTHYDDIGDRNGPSLFERTHSTHERSLRSGRLRGIAVR